MKSRTRRCWGLKRGRDLLWRFYQHKNMAKLLCHGDGGPKAKVVRIQIRISEVREA